MPKIKHITADLLSDEEMTSVSDKLINAERRMDEKLMEEIERRKEGFTRTADGIWVPNNGK
ncbi:MAG: hypothetical protein ACI4KF_05615 [Huintestinicola sp.]